QRDDLVRPGHLLQGRTEHVRGSDAPVQHDQGRAVAVDLVVQLDAVDFGIALRIRCAHGLSSRRRRVRERGEGRGKEERQWSGRSHGVARVTRSSSNCSNCSAAAPVPVLPEAMASSRACLEGYSSVRTSSVLPSFSSKVTVVTGPSSPSSFVQTMREGGVTSMYLPKNAIGCSKSGWLKTKRYVPPVRTSASQETSVMPKEGGVHHRISNS